MTPTAGQSDNPPSDAETVAGIIEKMVEDAHLRGVDRLSVVASVISKLQSDGTELRTLVVDLQEVATAALRALLAARKIVGVTISIPTSPVSADRRVIYFRAGTVVESGG